MSGTRYFHVLGTVPGLPGSKEGVDLCLHPEAEGNVVFRRVLSMERARVERIVARGIERGLLVEVVPDRQAKRRFLWRVREAIPRLGLFPGDSLVNQPEERAEFLGVHEIKGLDVPTVTALEAEGFLEYLPAFQGDRPPRLIRTRRRGFGDLQLLRVGEPDGAA